MVIWNFYSTKGLKYKIEGFLQTAVKYLEKFISKGCTSRLWGFYYLSRLEVDLLHKISPLELFGLQEKKEAANLEWFAQTLMLVQGL